MRGTQAPGEGDEPPDRELRDGDEPVLFECWLLERLVERDREPTECGDRVRERSREPEVERDREPERDGTEADEGEWDRERLRLLLGGVRESERDLDLLGDRLNRSERLSIYQSINSKQKQIHRFNLKIRICPCSWCARHLDRLPKNGQTVGIFP